MSKLKIVGILVLVIVSVLSLSILLEATKISISSTGRAWATAHPDGTVEYGCSGDKGSCTINIDISTAE